VEAAARLVRIVPGEKSLKNATPIQLQDLQVGDRILVAGKASDNTKVITATSVVVMKRSDVEAHKEEDRQDWQTRGLGGLVRAVDPAAGTVTISVTGFGGAKTFVVHASKDTRIRRYAPDSMRFDAARPSTLQEIQPGDQLRARGNRSADGTELTAEEIVSGSFRNVAGTVNSLDASAGTMNVQDLLSKKAVQVRVTPESQLHQPLRLNVQLTIAVQEQKIQVSDTAPTVDLNPANNAGAVVLSGKELEALPDDPDEVAVRSRSSRRARRRT
jgi:Copper binding periplasmic protein CusF